MVQEGIVQTNQRSQPRSESQSKEEGQPEPQTHPPGETVPDLQSEYAQDSFQTEGLHEW